jgi:spermidine/putrescine-binding protein
MGRSTIDAWLAGRLSRRGFNRALAAAGLGLAAMPLAARDGRAAGNVSVFTWGGYDTGDLCPQYVKKYGGPPDYALFASEEEALQKMLAGFEPDIAHPCSYNIKRWKDAGILQPIDTSRVPEYGNIWERFRSIPETSFDGKPYFVPFDAGTASILYRTDLVDPADVADPSWALLFSEKYRDKLSMYDTDTTFIEIAARIRGWYADYLKLSDEQLGEIKTMLAKQRELMKFYWSDQAQMEQAMAAGELVAAYAWSGSFKTLTDQGVKVGYMIPKEGILGYSCGLVRCAKGHGDDQAAYDFINAMLDPEAGKVLIGQMGYFHSNKKSYEAVGPGVLASLGIKDPAATFDALSIEPEPDEPYRSKYIKLVTDMKAGL